MAKSFFFYDLETTGLSARDDRIMQFAGMRTDENLVPTGEAYNILIRLSDDTLPSPEAIMVTGITPQQTLADGVSEAEFARIFVEQVATPHTVMLGFNTIRFDDEFIRHMLWRNFYDPYEWSYRDGRSRWDLLDAARMTRALRPDGIEWPNDKDGRAINKLEPIAAANGLDHAKAHDALSDVEASIQVARLIRDTQPKLYNYLFSMRDKNAVKELVNLDKKQPFVYTSGRYDAEFNKTTIAFPLTAAKHGNVLVYDLRYDPAQFIDRSVDELKAILFATREQRRAEGYQRLPVKELAYNKAPAVAPLGVLEADDGWDRIQFDKATMSAHQKTLLAAPHFAENIRSLYESRPEYPAQKDPEAQLYDGFLNDRDRLRVEAVRNADAKTLSDFHPEFVDERLSPLLLHYKARNFPMALSEDEHVAWEEWRSQRLQAKLPRYMQSIQTLMPTADDNARFVLDELVLWAESIMPEPSV